MSNLTYFARVLKHPGFILNENFLLHPFASFYTSRKILQNNMSLFDGIQKLTGESLENLKKYFDDISNNNKLHTHLDNQFENYYNYIEKSNLNNLKFSKENPAGRLNRQSQDNAGFFLYLLVRSLKPEIFVETGVSAGESSCFILINSTKFGLLIFLLSSEACDIKVWITKKIVDVAITAIPNLTSNFVLIVILCSNRNILDSSKSDLIHCLN